MRRMSGGSGKREIEIKLKLESAEQGRRLLRRAGFHVIRRRVHESNVVLDNAAGSLRQQGVVLRLRKAGSRTSLTLKGPAAGGKYKSRQELETDLLDFAVGEAILEKLGFRSVFRYEKYRTQYQGSNPRGVAMLDETPVGVFLELEGEPGWIDRTARLLGFSEEHYITATYADLNNAFRSPRNRPSDDMAFALYLPTSGSRSGRKRAGPGTPSRRRK